MLFLHAAAGAFALGCGVLQRRAGGLLFRVPLTLIIGIISAVTVQTGSAEFQYARHPLQQLTIVRSHQHTAGIPGQLGIEPLPPLTIEVVGGFIQ